VHKCEGPEQTEKQVVFQTEVPPLASSAGSSSLGTGAHLGARSNARGHPGSGSVLGGIGRSAAMGSNLSTAPRRRANAPLGGTHGLGLTRDLGLSDALIEKGCG